MSSQVSSNIMEEIERREKLHDELLPVVETEPAAEVYRRLSELHPADQADFLEELEPPKRAELVSYFDQQGLASLLEFFNESARNEVLQNIHPEMLSDLLVLIDDELAADLVEEMPEDRVHEILALMDMPTSAYVHDVLSMPEDSVGRWMSRDILTLQSGWNVEQALAYLRRLSPDTEHPFYLYTIDLDGVLQGVIDLRRLITADAKSLLSEVEVRDVISVEVSMDQEAAAERLRHYALLALPVVDNQGVLLGVLTADDVLDVQVEEATEDIYLQVGLDAESDALSTIGQTLRRRVPWLLVNLTIGFFSAFLVSQFESTLAHVALLAAFMPIIAGHGGNTGCQTTTLVVRGLALGEIYKRDVSHLVSKEMGFGLLYGMLAGLLTGTLAYLLTKNVWMAGIVMVAMMLNIVCAGLAGSLIPLGLKALRIDPALASTVWLTTFTDWIGFILLLGLGTTFLDKL
ncbi:MAG: magnesium transporter [Vulcanimicrobiota bacterium]